MNSPLQRLYKTKLALLATISTVVGFVLMIWSDWLSPRPGWAWPSTVISNVGGTLFSIGVLGVFFQYVGAQDQEQADDDRVRRMLKQTAPDMRDAVIDALAFEPKSLTDVVSSATLDRIIENSLGIQLGDPELARDTYADLRAQVLRSRVRQYDTRISVDLSPWDGGPESGTGSMFTATIRWEQRILLDSPVVRFASVSDPDEYRSLLDDPTCAIVSYFKPVKHLDAASPEAFQLLQLTLNGEQVPTRHTARSKGQIYIASVREWTAAPKPVTLAYTYRTLVQRNGHLLHLDISHPTKGFHVGLTYGDCGIRYVNVLDYLAGARQPRIAQLPPDDPTPSIEIDFDGWVFPKGGVAFVWVLEHELAHAD